MIEKYTCSYDGRIEKHKFKKQTLHFLVYPDGRRTAKTSEEYPQYSFFDTPEEATLSIYAHLKKQLARAKRSVKGAEDDLARFEVNRDIPKEKA